MAGEVFLLSYQFEKRRGQPGLFFFFELEQHDNKKLWLTFGIWFLVTGLANEKNIFSHATLDIDYVSPWRHS